MHHSLILHLFLQSRWLLIWWKWKRVIVVDGCHLCVVSFVFTPQIELSECCVWFQCITQWCCSCVSNLVACWFGKKSERLNCWWMAFVCCFFLSSRPRRSWVSVVFDFNASLIDVAPVSLMLFPVVVWIMKKSGLLMDAICLFLFAQTTQIEWCECCVWFQCLAQRFCFCISNHIPCCLH